MIIRPFAAAVLACALLGGCVTLLPKATPSTLYKLSIETRPIERPAGAPVINVLRAPTSFSRMSSGDQIITVTGAETASIASARWVAPAQTMFDESMASAFDASPTIRLSTRGSATPPDRILRVEVRTFEARYLAGQKAAPTVMVEMKAILTYPTASPDVKEHIFRAQSVARDNRVSAIVEAYGVATSTVLNDLVGWTDSAAVGPVSPVPPAVSPR